MTPVRKAPLTIDIVTLFPAMFAPLQESIIGRAQKSGALTVRVHDLRQWSDDERHAKVDDRSYGGGAGMVVRPEPVYRALKALKAVGKSRQRPWVVFLSPQGSIFSQKRAAVLSRRGHLVLICGHYEGVDERVMEWVDEEVSIGDYVLTGGELPAMVLVDSVARLVAGVVGDPASVENESFSDGVLDYPHYTRPSVWRGRKVPAVLLSGHHRDIDAWRRKTALENTRRKRPDLLRRSSKSGHTPGKPAERQRI